MLFSLFVRIQKEIFGLERMGEEMCIRDSYWVRSCEMSLGNVESQDALMRIVANGREKDYGIVMSCLLYTSRCV